MQLTLAGPGDVPLGQPLTLQATAPQAAAIELRHQGRVLGRIDGAEGKFTLDTKSLGLGLARLGAAAFLAGADQPAAVSPVVRVRVTPPAALDPIPAPEGVELVKGVSVRAADRPPKVAEKTMGSGWLQELGVQANEPIVLEGYFDVPADDLYQFQLHSPRQVQITVDETTIGSSADGHWKFLPVALKPGTHRLRVNVTGDGPPQLALRFGGPGAYSVGSRQFRAAVK